MDSSNRFPVNFQIVLNCFLFYNFLSYCSPDKSNYILFKLCISPTLQSDSQDLDVTRSLGIITAAAVRY